MPANDPTFGVHLRALRLHRGLGLNEAARSVGISKTYLSRLETDNEKSPPSVDLIGRLASLYHVDADDLCFRAGRVPADIAEWLRRPGSLSRVRNLMAATGIADFDLIGGSRG